MSWLADSIMEVLAEAIHSTLAQTDQFTSGHAYATQKTGSRPTFNVWWAGFGRHGAEARAERQPETTTFRFTVEVRVDLTKDAPGSQKRLMAVVQACHNAIAANNRLGNIRGVLRSRLTGGSTEPDVDDDQPMLVCSLSLEVDYAGTWRAPE